MQNELIKQIDGLMAKAWDDLREAADKKNTAALSPLNGRMAELGKMKKELQAIITRLSEMSQSTKVVGNGSGHGLRKIRIKVTQGMINQNLMTLTEALKNNIVRRGEPFQIETLPNNQKFSTILERVGNKLKARGVIGDFYRAANVQDGGIVELVEVTPGSWQLKTAEVGDFVV